MASDHIKAFFDDATYTVSYVIFDPKTLSCAVIDSVLDYDPDSGRTSTTSADAIIAYIEAKTLRVEWLLETHVHADHLSAAPYIQAKLGGKIAIGEHVRDVQKIFGEIFNAEESFTHDGRQFDHLFKADEVFKIGELEAKALHTPGHTPACMTYVVAGSAFVGDTLFMPDYGTARADFPGGDAADLYASIQRIFELPPQTTLFMCHDYGAPGRDEFLWETTVAEQRAHNVHAHEGITQQDFIVMREARDAELALPHLILPSVQVNMRAGHMPPAESNGKRYLKIPIDIL